ncbi:Ubiquitin-associated/translation elongation factor EF1B protein [Rhynchospora pubera]|uniref:Ubiquitin-associated/translation elongation factor EF1B protein n=1 Tax=Rhynchospora pubera TaxID=906938 RepID=A0AAV8FET2_9POAL|nr:Ubiquitin-associated/translation elongation factor EF1B protein [Rhynchospora pubera]
MSPAPKSKSKEKTTSTSNKLTKDQNTQKSMQKPALSNGGGSGTLPSAYNPISGTFHSLDPADPTTLLLNPVKFRSVDDPDDHSPTSHGDFDSASNHDSCSGESEDTVPKASSNGSGPSSHSRNDSVPGCDNEKREKIRQKNEKKHQRQRERRAQELHEKCSGYLMSRKLESLSQQLVAMGFSQEQATMALIQNEGRVEESVAWLFEGGEDSRQPEGSAPDLHCGVGLKIDITDELAKIVELEKRYKCTKQEVERAVVACEGDLSKAEENLKAQKQEAAALAAATQPKTPPPVPPKPEEIALPMLANQRQPVQTKVVGSVQPPLQQQRKLDRDFNYTRPQEPMKSLVQPLDRPPVKPVLPDYRLKQQQHASTEKRWPVGPGNPNSYPASASHMHVSAPQLKPEQHYPVSSGVMKGGAFPIGAGQVHPIREPVVVMQRPQTINPGKQNIPSTSPGLGHSNGSIPGLVESKMYNRELGQSIPGLGHVSNNGSANGNASLHQFVNRSHLDVPVTTSWSNGSSLNSPSSLGLFTGLGSSRSLNSTQQNEWGSGTGGYACDYTSIDWSLDTALLNSSSNNSIGSKRLSNTWSTMFMGGAGNMVRNGSRVNINTGGGGPYMSGLQDSTGNEPRFNEWTSPFSGEDILGASRKFGMSPPCRTGDSFLE